MPAFTESGIGVGVEKGSGWVFLLRSDRIGNGIAKPLNVPFPPQLSLTLNA